MIKINGKSHKIWAVIFIIPFWIVYYYFKNPTIAEMFVAVFAIYFLSICGSAMPDWDFDAGIKHHRNPLTHSVFFSVFFLVFGIYANNPTVWLFVCGIAVGVGSHLVMDCFPSSVESWLKQLGRFIEGDTVGDLRYIPEKMERPYLLINGGISILFGLIAIIMATL